MDEANPYDEPELREAWEEGWRAFWNGEPQPEANPFSGDSKEMSARLDGYTAAQSYQEHEA